MRQPVLVWQWTTIAISLVALAGGGGCQDGSVQSDRAPPMALERDIEIVDAEGRTIRVTNMPGAEEMEAISPDGRRVAFVGGATGIASIFVAEIPLAGEPVRDPTQLTNVGLERVRRQIGSAPPGYLPPPDNGQLSWLDNQTVGWACDGVAYQVAAPEKGVNP